MSKFYVCSVCQCNFVSTDVDPESLCKVCRPEVIHGAPLLENKLAIAIKALETAYHYFNCERDHSGMKVTSEALEKIK